MSEFLEEFLQVAFVHATTRYVCLCLLQACERALFSEPPERIADKVRLRIARPSADLALNECLQPSVDRYGNRGHVLHDSTIA